MYSSQFRFFKRHIIIKPKSHTLRFLRIMVAVMNSKGADGRFSSGSFNYRLNDSISDGAALWFVRKRLGFR